MQITDLVVRLIVLFIPGIVATEAYSIFENRGNLKNNREFIVNVFLVGFLSYTITFMINQNWGNQQTVFFESLVDNTKPIDFSEIRDATIVGAIIGVFQAIIINSGVLYKVGSILHITTKLGYSSVWDEVLDYYNKGITAYAYVSFLKRDLLYGGKVTHYSMSNSGKKELFLEDVVVCSVRTRLQMYKLESVYLCMNDGDDVVVEIVKGESHD